MDREIEIKTLEEHLKQLEEIQKEIINLAHEICSAADGAIYPIDLFVLAGIKKTLSINKGYISQLKEDNYVCGAALLRIQIDSALRLHASTMVKDTGKFVSDYMDGKPINQIRDKKGRQLTDTYLHTEVSKAYPWITSLYKESSGFVHLSEKHFFATFSKASGESKHQFILSDKDEFIPDTVKVDATLAMLFVNFLIVDICTSWLHFKKGRDTPLSKENT
jgi:hypothetical protein